MKIMGAFRPIPLQARPIFTKWFSIGILCFGLSQYSFANEIEPSHSFSETAASEANASRMETQANSLDTAWIEVGAPSVRGIQTQTLLPNRLGPMESVLWSEHGWMRRAFDFPLTPDSREHELKLRRTMLTYHQLGGYVTLASMVATCILGQMVINGDDGLADAKIVSANATVALYFATAALSIFTPPPLIRRENWSSTSTHKLLGILHFAGMVITPLIAPEFKQKDTQRTLHQVSGYATTAIFGAAMLVMTF